MLVSVSRGRDHRTSALRCTPASCLSQMSLLFSDARMSCILSLPLIILVTRPYGGAWPPFHGSLKHYPSSGCEVLPVWVGFRSQARHTARRAMQSCPPRMASSSANMGAPRNRLLLGPHVCRADGSMGATLHRVPTCSVLIPSHSSV